MLRKRITSGHRKDENIFFFSYLFWVLASLSYRKTFIYPLKSKCLGTIDKVSLGKIWKFHVGFFVIYSFSKISGAGSTVAAGSVLPPPLLLKGILLPHQALPKVNIFVDNRLIFFFSFFPLISF